MASLGAEFLEAAIRNEIEARDAYASLAPRVDSHRSAEILLTMSAEEEEHRKLLERRYGKLVGAPPQSMSREPAPDQASTLRIDFNFVEKSVFAGSSPGEALALCLGSEIDAIRVYGEALRAATDRDERRLLRHLVRFERGHNRRLERLIELEGRGGSSPRGDA